MDTVGVTKRCSDSVDNAPMRLTYTLRPLV